MRLLSSLALGLFLAAPAASAQTSLVGFGDVPCSVPTGIVSQVLCQRPHWCTTKGISPKWNSVPSAGATAWEPRARQAWFSEGLDIYVGYPNGSCLHDCRCQCKVLCKYPWFRSYGKKFGYITGMAILPRRTYPYKLFLATWEPHNGPFIVTFDLYGPCKIKMTGACQLTTNPNYAHGGLTVDPASGTLFYSLTNFQNFGGNMLYLAPWTSPCKPTCKWEIPKTCFGGPILGAAYASCRKVLTLTDGKASQNYFWNGMASSCAFKKGACCKAAPVKYHGIASPFCGGGRFRLDGKPSYTAAPNCKFKCPFCHAALPGYAGGPPAAGNTGFKLTVTQTPVSNPSAGYTAFAILLLNLQGHWNPTVLSLGCNPVTVYPALDAYFLTSGALTPTGTLPCKGKVEIPFPVPCAPAFCNLKIAGQWVLLTVHTSTLKPQTCLHFTRGFKVSF